MLWNVDNVSGYHKSPSLGYELGYRLKPSGELNVRQTCDEIMEESSEIVPQGAPFFAPRGASVKPLNGAVRCRQRGCLAKQPQDSFSLAWNDSQREFFRCVLPLPCF